MFPGYFVSLDGGNVSSGSSLKDITCKDDRYGIGQQGHTSTIGCEEGLEGSSTAVCQPSGEWKFVEDTCIVTAIKELLIFSEVQRTFLDYKLFKNSYY